MEARPSFQIWCSDRREDRFFGANRVSKYVAKSAALCFRLAEFVQDEQVEIPVDRCVDACGNVGEAVRIETAASGLRSEILRNCEMFAGRQVEQTHSRARRVAGTLLNNAAQAHSLRSQSLGNREHESVYVKACFIENGCKQRPVPLFKEPRSSAVRDPAP